jgi:hypothetical protein
VVLFHTGWVSALPSGECSNSPLTFCLSEKVFCVHWKIFMYNPQPAQTLCGIQDILYPTIIEERALPGLKFITHICETGRSSLTRISRQLNFLCDRIEPWNAKVEFFIYTTWGHVEWLQVILHSFDSSLDRREWSTHTPAAFQRTPFTKWIGPSVSPRGNMDFLDHKNTVHLPGLDHRFYHLVTYSITDAIIFLLNHISGSDHCTTAAGL